MWIEALSNYNSKNSFLLRRGKKFEVEITVRWQNAVYPKCDHWTGQKLYTNRTGEQYILVFDSTWMQFTALILLCKRQNSTFFSLYRWGSQGIFISKHGKVNAMHFEDAKKQKTSVQESRDMIFDILCSIAFSWFLKASNRCLLVEWKFALGSFRHRFFARFFISK